ncbi:uncharacterized protein [Aegilops tauschii subsp. strangulata]|uniref:uncharacterized protein n=1 Tax=Aegilops tauschii subsp. strangulata TaxID=200361 RepID=UPI003CC83A48
MQEAPLLEKLDWCFTSEDWTNKYPSTFAIPLAKTVSDHVPIKIQIESSIPRANIFRFENFWLEHHQFKEVVSSIWSQEVEASDSAKVIATKFKRPRKGLKNWAKNLSDLRKIIADTNFMILCYDIIKEFRLLYVEEHNARNILKAKATIKFRNNSISMIKDEQGHEHHGHKAKAAILFRAFKERMGTAAPTSNLLNLHQLLQPMEDLTELEVPFTKEEIDNVIKNMPADKSPGPDGFNATFLKSCWDIIAPDF